ncbi:MAG: IS200/IS605 family transposase [Aquirufa sp.]|jgi:putative transposase
MSHTNLKVHAVWATKFRKPLLIKEIRFLICQHIRMHAHSKGIFIHSIDGYHDHIHCLFTLPADLSLSQSVQILKGESAFWINKQNFFSHPFAWAKEYYAVSVSESVVPEIALYIYAQEQKHLHFDQVIKSFGVKNNPRL